MVGITLFVTGVSVYIWFASPPYGRVFSPAFVLK